MKWGRAVSVCLPGDSRTRAVVALGAMLGVAVASLAGLWPARADSLPPASLAARVQAVEGANQIRDLLISYGHLFDVRDLEGASQDWRNLEVVDLVWTWLQTRLVSGVREPSQ